MILYKQMFNLVIDPKSLSISSVDCKYGILNNIFSFFGEHHETFLNHKKFTTTSSEDCCEYMGPNELCIVIVSLSSVSQGQRAIMRASRFCHKTQFA